MTLDANGYASERAIKAWQMLEQGALLVDVRSPEEYQQEHLKHALLIPLEQVPHHDFSDKDQPIVVYCRIGQRSGVAQHILTQQGFTNVHNGGGLEEMKQAKP